MMSVFSHLIFCFTWKCVTILRWWLSVHGNFWRHLRYKARNPILSDIIYTGIKMLWGKALNITTNDKRTTLTNDNKALNEKTNEWFQTWNKYNWCHRPKSCPLTYTLETLNITRLRYMLVLSSAHVHVPFCRTDDKEDEKVGERGGELEVPFWWL